MLIHSLKLMVEHPNTPENERTAAQGRIDHLRQKYDIKINTAPPSRDPFEAMRKSWERQAKRDAEQRERFREREEAERVKRQAERNARLAKEREERKAKREEAQRQWDEWAKTVDHLGRPMTYKEADDAFNAAADAETRTVAERNAAINERIRQGWQKRPDVV